MISSLVNSLHRQNDPNLSQQSKEYLIQLEDHLTEANQNNQDVRDVLLYLNKLITIHASICKVTTMEVPESSGKSLHKSLVLSPVRMTTQEQGHKNQSTGQQSHRSQRKNLHSE